MANRKAYIDTDVLSEARRRLHHLFDIFDSVYVNFSGGKDSLVVMHITRQVAAERGIDHVNVVFRDEELIPDRVIDFVDSYRRLDWVRMWWYAVPLESNKFVLGKTARYVQWDPNRRWLRPKPQWAITSEQLGIDPDEVLSQYTMGEIQSAPFKGKVVGLTGMRADESLFRELGMLSKVVDNYVMADEQCKRSSRAHPIFDWSENDVFRYFYDEGIGYCSIYDQQTWGKVPLRVATPLHSEAAAEFGKWRRLAPIFYDQLVDLFPEMKLQERYWAEWRRGQDDAEYGLDYPSIHRWIEERIDEPHAKQLAHQRVNECERGARARPEGYPPLYVFQKVTSGATKRRILPIRTVDFPALEKRMEALRGQA